MDNSPHAYGYDLDNGIPIQSWFDDETDTELLKLIGFLKNVVDASDVRSVVRDHFKSYELVKNATLGYPGKCANSPHPIDFFCIVCNYFVIALLYVFVFSLPYTTISEFVFIAAVTISPPF